MMTWPPRSWASNWNYDHVDNVGHDADGDEDDVGDDHLASKELSVELELLSESDPPPTSLVFPWHCAVDYCFQLLFLLLLLLFPWHCAFDYWWTRLDWWKQQRQYFWTFWNVVCFSLKCWGAEGCFQGETIQMMGNTPTMNRTKEVYQKYEFELICHLLKPSHTGVLGGLPLVVYCQ